MSKDREVDKITIHYDDGEDKIIEKGFFCNMKEENGQMVLEFTMCHVAGIELEAIVQGCVELGFKLGMFGEEKRERRIVKLMEEHCIACGEIIPEGRQVCPICNREYEGVPALSRIDNETLICPECGTAQALDAALEGSDMPEKEKQTYKDGVLRAIYK